MQGNEKGFYVFGIVCELNMQVLWLVAKSDGKTYFILFYYHLSKYTYFLLQKKYWKIFLSLSQFFFCSCVFYVFVPGFLSRFSLLLFVNSSDNETWLIGYGMFVYVVGCWYYYLPNCLKKSYVFRSFVRIFIRFHVMIKLCVEIFVAKCRL